MKTLLLKIEHSSVAVLAIAVALLVLWHLHDAKVQAADQWQIQIDAQNCSALADSNRVLKNGWTAHLAVIAKDSADLAAMGKEYAALAAENAGLKKEKAKPVVIVEEHATIKPPDTTVKVKDSAGVKVAHEDDTCGKSDFHFSVTWRGDSARFEKRIHLDLSSMLVVRADGKREFRGKSSCPWVSIDGIEGAVFEDAPAVPEKKSSVWTSKPACIAYGAGVLRLAQVLLPALGIK